MKVLVTGGTGFIGSYLVKKLISDGHYVFCLVRDLKKGEMLRIGGAVLINGDIRDSSFIEKIPEGIDLVYHLAGVLRKWDIPAQVYYDTHVRGTGNLLQACVNKRIKRFIHCSSVTVLGTSGEALFDEKSPYQSTGIYENTKAEAEKLVLTYVNNGEIEATIIRPTIVYGPADLHVLRLFKAIKNGRFPLIDSGKALLQPTYIEDVISGFELCLNNKGVNQIYILAGERPITVREFVNIIAKIMGVMPPKINIPRHIANFIALTFEVAGKVFKFTPPFTRANIKFFTENKACKINKAIKELGYKPINLEEGLRKTIEWYKKNGYL